MYYFNKIIKNCKFYNVLNKKMKKLRISEVLQSYKEKVIKGYKEAKMGFLGVLVGKRGICPKRA